MSRKLTRHHLVPKSREGTNQRDNILMLSQGVHRAFHQVFDNLTPDEQLIRLLSINSKALKTGFSQDVAELIQDTNREDIYNPNCVKWK